MIAILIEKLYLTYPIHLIKCILNILYVYQLYLGVAHLILTQWVKCLHSHWINYNLPRRLKEWFFSSGNINQFTCNRIVIIV